MPFCAAAERPRKLLFFVRLFLLFLAYVRSTKLTRIYRNYVLARGGRVTLAPIAEVPCEWESPLAAFEATLVHEKKVTAMIDALCRQAEADKDFATANKLVWFVDEQVEEEQNAQDIIDSLKMVDDSKMGLYMIDKELAARAYTAPSIAGA